MAWEWSKKITRANVSGPTFEENVREALTEAFRSNAGSAPKFYSEFVVNRWVLQGENTKKDIVGGGSPDRSPFKMDGFTIFGQNHKLVDWQNNDTCAVVNFEFMTTAVGGLVNRIAQKIDYLSTITDAHNRQLEIHPGGAPLRYPPAGSDYAGTVRRIKQSNNKGRNKVLARIGLCTKYQYEDIDFNALDTVRRGSDIQTLLICMTKHDEKPGTAAQIGNRLHAQFPHNWPAVPQVQSVVSKGVDVPGAFDVTTPAGETIRVGQISRKEMLDWITTLEALEDAKPRFYGQITDRLFWDMTRFAFGRDNALSMNTSYRRRKRKQVNLNEIENLRSGGVQEFTVGPFGARVNIEADVYQFALRQDDLANLVQVERTMNTPEALQRTAMASHLASMARSWVSGKRSHLPIIVIADENTSFNMDLTARRHGLESSEDIIEPFGWRVIDGQHRVFSAYYKAPCAIANQFTLDVLMYKFRINRVTGALPTAEQMNEASGEIFYDVNYRAVTPPLEVALNHMARCEKFSTGWVGKGGNKAGFDRDLYSARIHAMRFLQELNKNSNVLANKIDLYAQGLVEDFAGAPGGTRKLLQPKSITTYMQKFFEFGWRNVGQYPLQSSPDSLYHTYSDPAKFGGVGRFFLQVPPAGGGGGMLDWGAVGGSVPNPSPVHHYGVPSIEQLVNAGFYSRLRQDFDNFCERIEVSGANPILDIQNWILKSEVSSSFLPALFTVFVKYYGINGGNFDLNAGPRIRAIGRAIAGITAPPNPVTGAPDWAVFKGGGGVTRLVEQIIASYNAARPRDRI